ncbi:MAG: type II toxin-antitoxin system VapC family toxin [Chloroflexota bacterium]|nr:type II toxin-antitoxin system VapC family toxin [Chloroflexota bacterium]MDE2841328.1 type II toxin-antitoxin system VapC family toxin [Chloroflexota bacterium]MDE2930237.1 type II toxin-antitoxin system VapC family toxin [Chloroflexota bacterium]
MNDHVVVDASLAFKWLVREIHTVEANALGRLWNIQGTQIAAPYLMPVEVTNALHQKVRRGELTVEAAKQRLESLLSSGLELHQPPGLYGKALELASRLGQSAAYDVHYLALAEALGCQLWTADERFYRAVSPLVRRVRWVGESTARG